MTSTSLLNEILKAQCCAADLGYKVLVEQMYLKPNAFKNFKNVRYIQALINILIRYRNVIYLEGDLTTCLTETEIETIIEQIKTICDSCGCCKDRLDITKDI